MHQSSGFLRYGVFFLVLMMPLFFSFAAKAQECPSECRLSGEQISSFLSGKKLRYPHDNATQDFLLSGRTLYSASGEDSWGRWRVDHNRYCSQWPPNDDWQCYEVSLAGKKVRFVDEYGNEIIGFVWDLFLGTPAGS